MPVPHPLKFQQVVFAADQSSVSVGGHRFVAQASKKQGSCMGCDFKDGFGCALWRAENDSSLCLPATRHDGAGVIWVPAQEAK